MDDRAIVARQLGRVPRGNWRVVTRCTHGRPTMIATAPMAEGEPFPTLFYLTCPQAVEEVSRLESAGEIERWRARLAADESLRAKVLDADAKYREMRAAEGGGADPASEVGIAGQRDPLGVKCLHAHVAAYLGGIDDPIGEAVYGMIEAECERARCGEEG